MQAFMSSSRIEWEAIPRKHGKHVVTLKRMPSCIETAARANFSCHMATPRARGRDPSILAVTFVSQAYVRRVVGIAFWTENRDKHLPSLVARDIVSWPMFAWQRLVAGRCLEVSTAKDVSGRRENTLLFIIRPERFPGSLQFRHGRTAMMT